MSRSDSERETAEALVSLLKFLDAEPVTEWTSRMEDELDGSTGGEASSLVSRLEVDGPVLVAALHLRQKLGRIDDVIHALGILIALEGILEPDEQLAKPSLASGNDPSRPFDLESDRRIAEFKFARWKGSDAARQRYVFKDLVHLAADTSDRQAQLFVLGPRPIHFLRSTNATASWGLDRFPPSRELFENKFGSLDVTISEFVNGSASDVELIDLESFLPEIFARD